MPELNEVQIEFLRHLKTLFQRNLYGSYPNPKNLDLKRLSADQIGQEKKPIVSYFGLFPYKGEREDYDSITVIWDEYCTIQCWNPWYSEEVQDDFGYIDVWGRDEIIKSKVSWQEAAQYLIQVLFSEIAPELAPDDYLTSLINKL